MVRKSKRSEPKLRTTFKVMCFIIILLFGCTLRETQALQRFCGKSLVEYMRLVCKDGFNTKPLKRRGNDFDYDTLVNDIFSLNMSDSSKSLMYPATSISTPASQNVLNPFLSNFHNKMMLTQTRRRRSPGGIYYECCLKSCTPTEMSAYCLSK